MLGSESRLLDDPPPEILVMGLGVSSVEFAVRAWIQSSDFWEVRSDLLQNLKAALHAAGIEPAYPQQNVHLFRHDDGAKAGGTAGAAR